ncbi:alpha-E domain-containing protein [Candidatus Marinarcus aquaticus]|uniref:Kinase n=1 Tax=Candidatus Marinarcus aquaticus TaxID=2044504 RepID=A0A4Q0XRE2_9BACT|nr:alpha-E domain-containing protein [Candidatus Marinarcus aquaticus]RXJ58154.1 kinase [Candidatus Marinarcus aquaticus]
MEQLLTAKVAEHLYWLGRYLERVESILMETVATFDEIIDVDKSAGKKLFKRLEVEIKYKNANEFLYEAVLGEHEANIYTMLGYVRENAIVSRAYIDLNAFGSIVELYEVLKQANNDHLDIDCAFLDKLSSRVSEIWGELSRKQERNISDYFIRLGKLVEKVDVHLRLKRDKSFSLVVMEEIDNIVLQLNPDAEFVPHAQRESYDTILNSINAKINKIIVEQ